MVEEIIPWWDYETTSWIRFHAFIEGSMNCGRDVGLVVGNSAVGKDIAFDLFEDEGCGWTDGGDKLRKDLHRKN